MRLPPIASVLLLQVSLTLSTTSACLVEYVLPGGSTGDASTGEGAVTDAGVTSTDTTGPTSGEACGAGLSPCGEACVDLARDDLHCGACGEYCKTDEKCIASACREILGVDCDACPCDACPDGTWDPSDGSEPRSSMCCPPVGASDGVVCVVGDADEVNEPGGALVCPA